MPDSRDGIAKGVADAGPVDQALGIPPEPVTPDLFEGDATAGSPVDESAKALGAPTVRAAGRRGRPAGSRNATTADVLKFLQARYRHPLLGMADVAATSPEQLAVISAGGVAANVTRADRQWAWSMWLACAKELAEYMVPKQPRAITLTPDSAPLIQMFLGDHQGAGDGAGVIDALRMGFHETPMKTTYDEGVGGEVLEDEVLDDGKPAGNSNA